jgi:hypothetical protein
MGGGIALRVKQKYPELFETDLKHGRRGDYARLGTFSTVKCHDDKQGYNMYGQYQFGTQSRQTDYEAVYTGLKGIHDHAMLNNINKLGCPFKMGCVLGGGSWIIVNAIINEIFAISLIEFYICNYEK